MLAHHPITGKPIRIMKTETHIYKNQKTIVWLRNDPQEVTNASRFQRWETLVTDVDLIEKWKTSLGSYPTCVVLTNPSESVLTWLKNKAPRKRHLLYLSKKVMDAYGSETFQKEKFLNVICLDEMAEMYPHIFHNYQQDELETLTVLSVAAQFRVLRFVGCNEAEYSESSVDLYYKKLQEAYKFQVLPFMEPEPFVLVQQYYEPTKSKRAKEIKKCLEMNIKCPFIDSIILLNEKDLVSVLPKDPKITQHIVGRRITYSDVILYIQTHIPENTIVAFSNSDIYFDESWKSIWALNMKDMFLSLLRYEEEADLSKAKLFGPRPDSQDTWVVYSNSVKSRTWNFDDLNFEFGKSGCDNAINVEMLKKKFLVANPCMSLKTYHCHSSGIRTYDPKDVVEKSVFLYLEPTGLHDLEPLQNIIKYQKQWTKSKSFSRRVHSCKEQFAKTFCSMVTRQETYHLVPESDNMYTSQSDDRVYQFNNSFVTPTGLVYGYESIYMGDQLREAWASTSISNMTPCIGLKSVLAAPLPDSVSSDLFSYLHEYLSRIFRLKDLGYNGDFWMPRDTQRLQDFMQFFKWQEQVMPVIPKDPSIVAYTPEATLLTPRSEPLCQLEDIEALRSWLRPYVQSCTKQNRVVILHDDNFMSTYELQVLEDTLEEKGYEVSVVYPSRSSPSYMLTRILGSAICITAPKQEKLFWMLPRDARVIELMSELQISGEGAHTAGACGLEYWIILVARAKPEVKIAQILQSLTDTLNMKPFLNTLQEKKPLILLPKGYTGFHGHSGDSFREMVALWFEQGLIELEYTTQSPYVWLGGIGETLLYDRANYDWLKQTPAIYKRILCGNPDAAQIENGVQWSFWARRPSLVMQRIEKGLPCYIDRTDNLVFYGKVENSVQESRRKNTLHEACDEFSMVLGVDTPYTFTQEEYLDKLANAKFGLCMAGFGLKCNREIECMALGTVPVVAPDVDMSCYSNPPQEDIHYIRLKTWESYDALMTIDNISQERWESMSLAAQQWYKENSSVEGLWNLTQKLATF